MSKDQLLELLDEIKAARKQNTMEHEAILANAHVAAELSAKIEQALKTWNTFWSVIMMVKSAVFTLTFVMAMAYFLTQWADWFGM